jgi:predicted CXXCH cytochrome family protein
VSVDPGSGQAAYVELQVETRRLTVGRAPDQHIQTPDLELLPRYAEFRAVRDGIVVYAVSRQPLLVDGQACRSARVLPGQVYQFGTTRVTVDNPTPQHALVLNVDFDTEIVAAEALQSHAASLADTRLGKRLPALLLVSAIVAIFLLPQLWIATSPTHRTWLRNMPLVPSDVWWSPGRLSTAHQSIGRDCNQCHVVPFQPVANSACNTCHESVQHHVAVDSGDRQLFEPVNCVGCHQEHNEPDGLLSRDQRLCTDCHADIRHLKPDSSLHNVNSFAGNHPEFAVTLLQPNTAGTTPAWRAVRTVLGASAAEHSNLKFSHKAHLDPRGIKSPDGDRKLGCQDCHQSDASGRHMEPVRMETACARCHSLQFDEHDPSTVVPHGDLERLFKALREHFSQQFLFADPHSGEVSHDMRRRAAGNTATLTREQQRLARDWAERQSLRIAHELLEERVCIECHIVTRQPDRTGFEQWRVEPVRLTQHWMPQADFNHKAHQNSACTDCHNRATKSEQSADILMPVIAQCRTCHGAVNDTVKLASDCVMCHQFHLPGRGLLDPQSPKPY